MDTSSLPQAKTDPSKEEAIFQESATKSDCATTTSASLTFNLPLLFLLLLAFVSGTVVAYASGQFLQRRKEKLRRSQMLKPLIP
jgi:hypothetical protein